MEHKVTNKGSSPSKDTNDHASEEDRASLPSQEEDTLLSSGGDEADQTLVNLKKSRKKRLSGAGKKRLKWLLHQGLPMEEAFKKASEPWQSRSPLKGKRTRSDDSTPKGSVAKRAKGGSVPPASSSGVSPLKRPLNPSRNQTASCSGGQSTTKKTEGTYSQALRGFKVGIIPQDYPETILSVEQIEATLEKVLDIVLEKRKPGWDIHFLGQHKRPGWACITCGNEATVKWLKEIQDEITPWEGASLKVVEADEMPHTTTLVANLPGSQEYSNERILQLLATLNNCESDNWRIIRRTTSGPTQEVTFVVDATSMTMLEKLGLKVRYRFGEVRLRSKTRGLKAVEAFSGPEDGDQREPMETQAAEPTKVLPSVAATEPRSGSSKSDPGKTPSTEGGSTGSKMPRDSRKGTGSQRRKDAKK